MERWTWAWCGGVSDGDGGGGGGGGEWLLPVTLWEEREVTEKKLSLGYSTTSIDPLSMGVILLANKRISVSKNWHV